MLTLDVSDTVAFTVAGAQDPAPSREGSKVAFVSPVNDVPVISVFDIATQTVSSWSVPGRYPAWSPTGAYIAFTPNGGGSSRLVNPDGTGIRVLTELRFDEEPLNWSADGRWLVIRARSYGVVLLDVISGSIVPVGLLNGELAAPSFR